MDQPLVQRPPLHHPASPLGKRPVSPSFDDDTQVGKAPARSLAGKPNQTKQNSCHRASNCGHVARAVRLPCRPERGVVFV